MADALVSFAAIYQEHAPAVFRCLLAWSRNHALAEDLLADTFVNAITADTAIQLPTARGYLIAIARNLWLGSLRRRSRMAATAEFLPDTAHPSAHPDQAIELQRALAAIDALPETLREPIVLYAQGGLSYEEISAQLNLPMATVKVRIFRARQKLEKIR
jgi:RNA polymerase sigma factor (sigma-70 family)